MHNNLKNLCIFNLKVIKLYNNSHLFIRRFEKLSKEDKKSNFNLI